MMQVKTQKMGGVSYFWLRFHSYSDKFNSDSSPTPNIFLISYCEIFKVWETKSDVKITFHPTVVFVSFYNLIPDSDSNKLTKKALRIGQKKTPYSDSIPDPILGFAHLCILQDIPAAAESIFETQERSRNWKIRLRTPLFQVMLQAVAVKPMGKTMV